MMVPLEALPHRRISPRFPKVLHREVHRLLRRGVPIPVIAARFNRTEDAIVYHQVQCAAVDAPFDIADSEASILVPNASPKQTGGTKKMPQPKLTETQKQEIRTKLGQGKSPNSLAREYGVTYQTIQYYAKNGAKAPQQMDTTHRDKAPGAPPVVVTESRTAGIPVAPLAPISAEPAPVEQATHLALEHEDVPMGESEPTDADPAVESLRRLSDQLNQRLHTARLELNRYQILVGRLEDDLHAVHRSLRLVAETRDS